MIFSISIIRITLGISRVSFAKILAASSINNLLWLVLSSQINSLLLLLVFSIYTILVISLVMLVKIRGNPLLRRGSKSSPLFLSLIFLSFLSLGGLPPLLGFLRKAIVVKESLSLISMELLLVIVFRSLFILSYYVSMSISSIIFYSVTISHFNGKSISACVCIFSITLNLFIPVSLLLCLNSKLVIIFNGVKMSDKNFELNQNILFL